MALALALKYRPKVFSDLIGQEAISKTLSMALDKNRIVHAYLFSGLRGSGKTSSARIFARALVCEKGPISTPCGECDICKATLEGRNLDIIEKDAASNRGIDDIKDIIEHTRYAPSMSRYQIFIIDEVHMLTKEAFNALLKTLEEPPEYVKFILATTDPLKLPATIISRTQHFRFKKIPQKAVISHLENILEKEGVSYEPNALEIIARSGGGSLRDTLTLTDQAINYCDKHLTTSQITQMLGIIDPKNLKDFFASIIHKDEGALNRSLEVLGEYECEMIIDEMLLFLKDALLAGDQDFPLLLIDRFLGILSTAKSLLNLNPDGAFVLMLMSLKMREALKLKDINEAIKELEKAAPAEVASAQNIVAQTMQNQEVSQKTSQETNVEKIAESKIADSSGVDSSANVDSGVPNTSTQTQATQTTTTQAPTTQTHFSPQIGAQEFSALASKIADRSYELGETFARAVAFERWDVATSTLFWYSNPSAPDKATLKQFWGIIQALVQEAFAPIATSAPIHIKNTFQPAADALNPQNPASAPNVANAPTQAQTSQDDLPQKKTSDLSLEPSTSANPTPNTQAPQAQQTAPRADFVDSSTFSDSSTSANFGAPNANDLDSAESNFAKRDSDSASNFSGLDSRTFLDSSAQAGNAESTSQDFANSANLANPANSTNSSNLANPAQEPMSEISARINALKQSIASIPTAPTPPAQENITPSFTQEYPPTTPATLSAPNTQNMGAQNQDSAPDTPKIDVPKVDVPKIDVPWYEDDELANIAPNSSQNFSQNPNANPSPDFSQNANLDYQNHVPESSKNLDSSAYAPASDNQNAAPAPSQTQPQNAAQSQTQIFLQENNALIQSLKHNFGVKQMLVIENNDAKNTPDK